MRHVILFTYILAFMSGFSALSLVIFAFYKTKDRLYRYYSLLLSCWTAYLAIFFCRTYIANMVGQSTVLSFVLTTVSFLVCPPFFFLTAVFTHELVKSPMRLAHRIVNWALLASYLPLYIAPFLLRKDFDGILGLLNTELAFYATLNGLLVGVYTFILILVRRKNIENALIKKLFKVSFFIGIFFTPGFFVDINFLSAGLDFQKFPYGFRFNSLYYLVFNIISIVFFVRSFSAVAPRPAELSGPALKALAGTFKLTERETEILERIVKGEGTKKIAVDLEISPATVRNHVYNLYQKTGTENRVGLLNRFKQP